MYSIATATDFGQLVHGDSTITTDTYFTDDTYATGAVLSTHAVSQTVLIVRFGNYNLKEYRL